MNLSLLPENIQKEYKRYKKAPSKYGTELDILLAEIKEKYPTALNDNLGSVPKLPKSISSLFTPIDKPPKPEKPIRPLVLGKSDIAKWLGKPEAYEYVLLLRGDKGAGKSRLAFQLMNVFAQTKLKTCFFSLEMDVSSSVIKSYSDTYLSKFSKKNIFSTSQLPNGLNTIHEASKAFDVVCVDSWSKIPNIKQTDFDSLRKAHKDTIFIIISQSNTKGTTRGGNMADFDASAVVHVHEGGKAIFEKNRFATGGESLVYDVFGRKIV